MKGRLVHKVVLGVLCALVLSCKNETPDNSADLDNLNLLVKEVNKMAPRQLDEITRLDSASATAPNIINYYYTFKQPDTLTNTAEIKRLVQQGAQANMDGIAAKKIFKGPVLFHYVYHDTIGKPVFEFTIKPTKE
ncbi:hypothetical protein AM493_11215 [Flavobacterium akiainvivens]|uniref:Lipoprotein n=1 Tax=Flavobacterium akiainvivens TaxID=1202724 RepID=A0A0M9VIB7_9FLAO|nr:hypothetical protein [Flavobacterium akiainvivens]KOS06540.1 hypothetical protein AM493_11215 [Flavobacterium akiainvivens]SFQ11054.1 hypothetical protein SAMN05444144_101116 [Flavobacterium akiainvivens]